MLNWVIPTEDELDTFILQGNVGLWFFFQEALL